MIWNWFVEWKATITMLHSEGWKLCASVYGIFSLEVSSFSRKSEILQKTLKLIHFLAFLMKKAFKSKKFLCRSSSFQINQLLIAIFLIFLINHSSSFMYQIDSLQSSWNFWIKNVHGVMILGHFSQWNVSISELNLQKIDRWRDRKKESYPVWILVI
jgi:hypothetical protein